MRKEGPRGRESEGGGATRGNKEVTQCVDGLGLSASTGMDRNA